METKKKRRSSLYCGICSQDSNSLLERSIPLVKFVDPVDSLKFFAICKKCTSTINRKFYIQEKEDHKSRLETENSLTPGDILEKLNKFVMGQDQAKRSLSIVISNHIKSLYNRNIQKSNALIIGPTGSGKTELVRSLAKIANLPFVVADATTFTAAGYVGDDVQSMLIQLYEASERKKSVAERGVIFLDEIDKLASSRDNSGSVGTVAVQQALLKIMEGGLIKLNLGDKRDSEKHVYLDTSKILFICSGAFPGISNSNKKSNISLNNKIGVKPKGLFSPKDLQAYGLIPEFIGRISVICQTNTLGLNDLISILKDPENSLLTQYQELFLSYGVVVNFSKKFINEVVSEALLLGTGARGLKSILDKKLEPYFFDTKRLSKKKITNI